ncbi:hypothetical protein [Amycolatopsis magusensis]|uniref:hypothetical protein n=1 Tax=Amycolatopsis magusensis TaxID=882444 RepID=UPI0037B7F9F4
MPNHTMLKGLLIGIACLIGVIVGLVTGILTKLGGSSMTAAVLAGGGAFAGTTLLGIAIINSLIP